MRHSARIRIAPVSQNKYIYSIWLLSIKREPKEKLATAQHKLHVLSDRLHDKIQANILPDLP